MRAYVAFIKKEGLELVRTYKLLLMILIFFAFGVISWNTGWMEGYQEVAIFCFIL